MVSKGPFLAASSTAAGLEIKRSDTGGSGATKRVRSEGLRSRARRQSPHRPGRVPLVRHRIPRPAVTPISCQGPGSSFRRLSRVTTTRMPSSAARSSAERSSHGAGFAQKLSAPGFLAKAATGHILVYQDRNHLARSRALHADHPGTGFKVGARCSCQGGRQASLCPAGQHLSPGNRR